MKITNGRLSLGKTKSSAKPLVLEKLTAELRDFSATSVFPFSLSARLAEGGVIKLEGKAGPIDAADAALTPVDASLSVAHIDLAACYLSTAAAPPTAEGCMLRDTSRLST